MQHLLGQPAPRSESLAPAAIVLQRYAGEAPAQRGANHRAPGPELCHGNSIWEPTMTQPLTLDEQRAIARRLFEALCAKYPERYIALIQPRDTAADGLSAPDLTAVESSPASLS